MHVCEHPDEARKWQIGRKVLDVLSTMFSCLFMLELGVSVWGFGVRLVFFYYLLDI